MKLSFSPTILITGKNGQVGWELQRTLLPLGKIFAFDRQEMDLTNNDSIRQYVLQIKPDVIVNAAAYTAVDKAEEEHELAMQINGIATGVLAEEAKKQGALLIHYSTDYVFDGSKQTPYTETDEPKPINFYGTSKWAGEQAIQAINAEHLILRTSWVYGSRGNNFLLTMLKLMQEKEHLRVIADQKGTPTWARVIAETTAQIVKQSLFERQQRKFQSGIYNITSSGETTWHGFATKIKDIAKQKKTDDLKIINIAPISTTEYPTPAKRPSNSCLTVAKLQQKYNVTMPSWDKALELCMEGLH